MSWPLASHFSTMLQTPQVAFRDARLKRSLIEKDAKNQPRPWAGAFAVVYKGFDPERNEPFALRVFTSESTERRERYEIMSAYCESRRLRSLVGFEYRDRAIRSAGDGKWYPLIVMEWVQGETLFKWVRARCLAGDAAAIERLAERWVEVIKELGENGIAHGDLQHANIMVADSGDLKLVDYDCMCVPALVGRRNLEVGVVPYQHPARDEHTLLSLDLDHFSALQIYVGLRSLAADPRLWHKYVEQPSYDKLLFRKEDFASPETSSLYFDLMQLADSEVRDLVGQLFAHSRTPMDQVPPLEQLANSYAKVEDLLMRQRWEEAVQLLNRRGNFRDAPHHLKLLIHQAYENVCRQQAWSVFQRAAGEVSEAGDRSAVDAWNEKLFTNYEPAEQHRGRVAEARNRVAMLDRLRYVVQQHSGAASEAGEKAIVEAAAHIPEGYRYSLAGRVDQARRCTAALTRLVRVMEAKGPEAAFVAAMRDVDAAGCRQLAPRALVERAELAMQRLPSLQAIGALAADLTVQQRDARLLEIWNDKLLKGVPEAQAWRSAWQDAAARQELLARLHAAVQAHDEPVVAALMKEPALAGYPLPPAWMVVIRKACQRVERLEGLLTLLQEGRREGFREQFDARLVRQCADMFAPYRTLLSNWVAEELLAVDVIGLRPALGRASLIRVEEAEGNYRARWTWPQPRFAERCLLGICATEPQHGDNPETLPLLKRIVLDRAHWESAGGSRLLAAGPEWADAYVVVWGILDLGFQTLHSRPLILGQIESRSRWPWKKWPLFGAKPQRAAVREGNTP